MIALHRQAAKDLQTAITKNPALMPVYSRLISIAMASEMPFTPFEIFQKAEKIDKRNYYVRATYMLSLRPRWGGSYDAMAEFGRYAIRYVDLNPRFGLFKVRWKLIAVISGAMTITTLRRLNRTTLPCGSAKG